MNLENKKQLLILLSAFLLGFIAVILTAGFIEKSRESERKKLTVEFEKKNAAMIAQMENVRKSMDALTTKQNATIKKINELEQRPQVTQVSKPEKAQIEDTLFSLKTPPGKRALTIMIDSLSAVGGLINPGDYVDILAEMEVKSEDIDKPKKVTSVIMQNVQVLAVGTNFQPIGSSLVYQAQQKARSLNVTLALSPEETGLVTFAQSNGKLQLSLRSPSEQRTQSLQVASWQTLSDYMKERQGTEIDLSPEKKKIEEKKDEEVKSFIEIYRGGQEL